MPDPNVREVGHAEGLDGLDVHVGVDYDCVTLTIAGAECRLELTAVEKFVELLDSAVGQAAEAGAR